VCVCVCVCGSPFFLEQSSKYIHTHMYVHTHTQVAEGYATAFSLVQLIEKTQKPIQRERTFPIIYGVCKVLDGTWTPQEGVT
jgi:glycerol-3-phosphate dehydrogenase